MTVIDAIVLGAGVAGLTTARAIVDSGLRVKVLSATFSPNTTSNTAAAIWHPFYAQPADRVLRWAKASFVRFRSLYSVPGSGVSELELTEYYREGAALPWWSDAAGGVERVPASALSAGYASAYRARVPLVEPEKSLPFLRRELEALGTQFEHAHVAELVSLRGQAGVVVNCTGLGAAELAADAEVYPIRGQIIRARPCHVLGAHIDDTITDRPTYVIARTNDCVIGGTADEEAWSLEASEPVSLDIEARARARALLPGIDIQRDAVKVGLRPGRSQVRLELERTSVGPVVHNYGHGGSGFTLSWGCAEEAAQLTLQALRSHSVS